MITLRIMLCLNTNCSDRNRVFQEYFGFGLTMEPLPIVYDINISLCQCFSWNVPKVSIAGALIYWFYGCYFIEFFNSILLELKIMKYFKFFCPIM